MRNPATLMFAAATAFAATPWSAFAADRIGIRPGMSASEVDLAMKERCPDNYVSPPFLTCVNGGFVVTATFTRKDRLHWLRLLESSQQDPETYARELAAELGFAGTPEACASGDRKAFCARDAAGNVLAAGSTEYDGMRTSYFFNDSILSEDGGQK